jgi:hypothetical protein
VSLVPDPKRQAVVSRSVPSPSGVFASFARNFRNCSMRKRSYFAHRS